MNKDDVKESFEHDGNVIENMECQPENDIVEIDSIDSVDCNVISVDFNDNVMQETDSQETIGGESTPLLEESSTPLNSVNIDELLKMLSRMRDMVGIMEDVWNSTKNEFNLTDSQMKDLYNYNEQNRDPEPEDESTEFIEGETEYDPFNGVLKLTDGDIVSIFGEEHDIIGIDTSVSIGRIHQSIQEFFQWQAALKEYTNIHNGYLDLMDAQEDAYFVELEAIANSSDNEEAKEKAISAITSYKYNKNLDFLREPLDEKMIKTITIAFSDEGRIEYWLNKARVKLKQLGISSKVILEISQLEKRFLDEKYHKNNNVFLLYYLLTVRHSDPYDKKQSNTVKVISITFTLDRFIRNTMSEETRQVVLDNLIAFSDQFPILG